MSMEKGVEDKESVREAEVTEAAELETPSAWSTSRWELWSFYLYYVVRYHNVDSSLKFKIYIVGK